MPQDESKESRTVSSERGSSPSCDGDLIAQTRVERVFNTLQFFTLSIAFMSSWESIAGNLYTVFLNGGPQTLVWGFLLVWAGALAQSASLAEMAAVQPIAGAMYHWTYALAPSNVKRFATWLQAWITWAGWISMTVGIGNSTAYWITSLVQLNYPNYVAQLWHTTLMIWAMLLFTTTVNLFKFGKFVPWIEFFAGTLHVVLFFVFIIVLLAMGPKHDAEFVFFGRVDSSQTSGWTNDFVGWNLGLQTSVWCFVGKYVPKSSFTHMLISHYRLRRCSAPQRGGSQSSQHRTSRHVLYQLPQWSASMGVHYRCALLYGRSSRCIGVFAAYAGCVIERHRISTRGYCTWDTSCTHQCPGHDCERGLFVTSELELGSRWRAAKDFCLCEVPPLISRTRYLLTHNRSTLSSASQPEQSCSLLPSSRSSRSST